MSIVKNTINQIIKRIFGVDEVNSFEIGNPTRFLVVRQHNQLGDLLISTPMLRAIKEKYPKSDITAIVSPQNYKAYYNNPYLSKLFIFDKKKLFKKDYYTKLREVLREKYDVAVVPAVTSISFNSNFIARLSNSQIRIGVRKLNDKINTSSYLFDRQIDLDWNHGKTLHVAKRNLAILEPFGITTNNLKIVIESNNKDVEKAKEFIETLPGKFDTPVIGFHVGAGKIQNRWSVNKFSELIEKLRNSHNPRIYFSCGSMDDEALINEIGDKINCEFKVFKESGMGILKEVIELSDLFITNDTGPMHAAASTSTAVISLFGPTDAEMWAPIGENKTYLWSGDNIDSISVDNVYRTAKDFLG